MRPLLAAPLLLLLGACDSRATVLPAPEAAVLTFDAAMLERDASTPPADGGVPDTGSPDGGDALPPAVVNPDGVLTPFPHIRYAISPPEFEIVSANFVVEHDGDTRGPLLSAYFEIRNGGAYVDCDIGADVYLDFRDLVGIVEGEPYYQRIGTGPLFTVTSDCIAPGRSGVLHAVQRGIDETDLALAGDLSITLDIYRSSVVVYTPAGDGPLVDVSVRPVEGGYGLGGTITLQRTLHNYAMRFYPRDSRGVIVDELLAFPGHLEILPIASTQPFETLGTPRPIESYLFFDSWIVD
ncbi:MAG: hypothetical protein IT378_14805 [Sandaracinaceae bacterium]|nr:hypothetical protein [Sandaracinaceae bacterium]